MNLLSCLLPIHVLSKFLDDSNTSRSFSDVYNDCTILFADIAGFTKYSSSV
jgi:class 3 adenylate cyclase